MTELGPQGLTAINLDGLAEIGAALTSVADTLGGVLQAVDGVPVDAVGQVLGPIGADFVDALVAATARHRQVLADCTEVAAAAGAVVSSAASAYQDVDTAGASSIAASAAESEQV